MSSVPFLVSAADSALGNFLRELCKLSGTNKCLRGGRTLQWFMLKATTARGFGAGVLQPVALTLCPTSPPVFGEKIEPAVVGELAQFVRALREEKRTDASISGVVCDVLVDEGCKPWQLWCLDGSVILPCLERPDMYRWVTNVLGGFTLVFSPSDVEVLPHPNASVIGIKPVAYPGFVEVQRCTSHLYPPTSLKVT